MFHMKKHRLLVTHALVSATGTFAYIMAIVLLLSHAKFIFGETENEFLIPIFMLLLFVISASITGFLVLGEPLQLFFGNQRKEAVQMLFATLGCLVLFWLVVAGLMIAIR
jgi:hypothetical protein